MKTNAFGAVVPVNQQVGEWAEPIRPEILPKLLDGPQTVRVSAHVDVHYYAPTGSEPLLVSYPIDLTCAFELVPADVETVKLVPVAPDAGTPRVTVSYAGYHAGGQLIVGLRTLAAEQAVAYTVIARAGAHDARLGTVLARPYQQLGLLLGAAVPDFFEDHVELVLLPSPEAATRTIDVFEILQDELVVPNVKIARQRGPATAPTR